MSAASERKCWTCGSEHDPDDSCKVMPRAAQAPFGTVSEASGVGPIFSARFGSECDTCSGTIHEGDQIRIVDGSTECENCIHDARREGHP